MLRPLTSTEQEDLLYQYLEFAKEISPLRHSRAVAWLEGWGDIFEKSIQKCEELDKIKKPKLTKEMGEDGQDFRIALKQAVVLASALYGIVIFDLLKSKSPLIEQLNEMMEHPFIKDAMNFYFKNVTMEYLGQSEKIKDPIIKESEMDEIRKLLKMDPLNVHFKHEDFL